MLELYNFLVYNIDRTKEINLQTKNEIIRVQFMELARKRGPEKTFCPSEIARQVEPHNWRARMEEIRSVGQELVADDFLLCTQKGNPVDPEAAMGPIRLGFPQQSYGSISKL